VRSLPCSPPPWPDGTGSPRPAQSTGSPQRCNGSPPVLRQFGNSPGIRD